jgi:hypothetical protein
VQLNAAAEYESALGAALHELIAHLGAVQGAVYAVELEGMRRLATAGLASGADASRLPDGLPAELVAQVLQSDHGGVCQRALGGAPCRPAGRFSPSYSSHINGRVERSHRSTAALLSLCRQGRGRHSVCIWACRANVPICS